MPHDYSESAVEQARPTCDLDKPVPYRLEPDEYQRIISCFAHDIRNPLMVVGEYASLMRDGLFGSLSDEQNEVMSVIRMRADEIDLLIESLETMAQLACQCVEANCKPCTLDELSGNLLDRLRARCKAKDIKFEVRIDGNVALFVCDPVWTRQVLVFLWWCVLRVSPPRSAIVLESTRLEAGDAAVFRMTNDRAHVEIADAPEWDPGVETARDGLVDSEAALMVNAAAELARLMNGRVSILEDSTGFEFYLPTQPR